MASFESLFITVLALLVLVTFGGVLFALIMATFQFLFSGGDAEKIKKAWNSIRFAILGAIITLLILFMVPAIAKYTKVNGYEKYNYANIFKRATDLVSGISKLMDTSSEAQKQGVHSDFEL